MLVNDLIKEIEQVKTRSKWQTGVKEYALELLEDLELDQDLTTSTAKKILLNGASNWHDFSWGGCSWIYNCDICKKLATTSEQKRTHNGHLKPNKNEEWLDTQARALWQASKLIEILINRNTRGV